MKKVLPGLVLILICGRAHALEVEQAYRMIPHNRTVFLLYQSNLPAIDARQVARLLTLAEKAMVARVDARVNGAAKTGYLSRIDDIMRQIDKLKVPERIAKARKHILSALQQHRKYFELENMSGSSAEAKRSQLIQSSHRHLIAAYQQLMEAYPDETKHNRQAFFDYLSALDFI